MELLLDRGASIDNIGGEGKALIFFERVWLWGLVSERLLERCLDYTGPRGKTSLMIAAQFGNAGQVRQLISAGANVEKTDERGRTALFWALERFKSANDVVNVLLKEGASLGHKDIDGRTPLYAAVDRKDCEIISLLLQSGAEINICDAKGETPLSNAVQDRSAAVTRDSAKEMVSLLLDGGADITHQNSDGLSIRTIALRSGGADMVNYLRARSLGSRT